MTPGKPDGGTGTYPTDTLIPFLCSCCHNRTLQQYRLLSVTRRAPDQTPFGLDHDHTIAAEHEKAGLTFFLNLLSVLSVAEDPGVGTETTESKSILDLVYAGAARIRSTRTTWEDGTIGLTGDPEGLSSWVVPRDGPNNDAGGTACQPTDRSRRRTPWTTRYGCPCDLGTTMGWLT
jgi:hypothetical protein